MLQLNLLLIVRSFKRFKSTFIINLIGLSTGLASALLIYLWVSDELTFDKFHEKDTQLFQAMLNRHNADRIETDRPTPAILAEALVDEAPEVEFAVAVIPPSWFGEIMLSADDKKIKAPGQFAGKDFFKMFSYDLVRGNENQVLSDKNSIAISQDLANRLFNTTENITGKVVEFKLFGKKKQATVSGIFEDVPSNSSDQFDFVLPFEVFKDLLGTGYLDWGNTGPSTFVLLRAGTNLKDFNTKIAGFIKSKNRDSNVEVFLRPYSDRYLYNNYENGVLAGGRIEYVRLFSIIASFILVIACINFINLSTAKASGRLKEVGIKKAVGASRNALIFQYLAESMLMTFLSLIIALVLVTSFLPQFNQITGKQLTLSFDVNLILSALGIVLVTGMLAGSYPALYLSGFNPVMVLKGKSNISVGGIWARKGLVVFQFMLSVILIAVVMVVYKQIEYIQTKNLGFNKDNIIYFGAEGKIKENIETFISEIKNIPGIVNASNTSHRLLGSQTRTSGLQWDGKNPDDIITFETVWINYDLIETLGIEMVSGRTFSRDFSTDSTKIIFNEAAIAAMGLTDPVGRVINLWGENREIIGVSKNFHFESLHENVKPLFFLLAPKKTDKVVAKVQAGMERETIDDLQKLYETYNPGFPFDYKFMDEEYQALYAAEQRVSTLSKYFAGLAIVISCLGLFGLAAFTAQRRIKEIGIRKILGASDYGIVRLLTGDFTQIVILAIIVALPVSYFIARKWLEGFAYRIDLEWWFFIASGLLALLIAWFTVGLQIVKAARVNPTECLKEE